MRKRWVVAVTAGLLVLLAVWLWTPDKDRESLESRYAQRPSTFIQVNGLRMHVRDTGPRDAPAIVMLHGLGSSLHTWQAVADEVDDQYRVIRIDLPGSGLTSPDPDNDYSDERSIAVLASLMDQLDIESATLVGHSMGGRIAWRFAHALPTRVDKLVLIAPDGFSSPGFDYDTAPEVPASMRLMPYVLPKSLLMMAMEPAYANPDAISIDTRARYYDLMLAPGIRRAMIFRLQQVILKNPVPMLRQIDIPTLLVWGASDAMIPLANADDYLEALPDARLVVVQQVGHLPHEESPDQVVDALRSFLLP